VLPPVADIIGVGSDPSVSVNFEKYPLLVSLDLTDIYQSPEETNLKITTPGWPVSPAVAGFIGALAVSSIAK
jgi:hypothetical protein